ncbi:phage regulatory CII family protein, partial [Parvibaculum sp.]
PHLTREIARQLGHVLIALPRLDGTGEWGRHLGAIAEECGQAIAVVGQALSVGGTITAEEVRALKITREVDEAIEKLVSLRAALVALEGGAR